MKYIISLILSTLVVACTAPQSTDQPPAGSPPGSTPGGTYAGTECISYALDAPTEIDAGADLTATFTLTNACEEEARIELGYSKPTDIVVLDSSGNVVASDIIFGDPRQDISTDYSLAPGESLTYTDTWDGTSFGDAVEPGDYTLSGVIFMYSFTGTEESSERTGTLTGPESFKVNGESVNYPQGFERQVSLTVE